MDLQLKTDEMASLLSAALEARGITGFGCDAGEPEMVQIYADFEASDDGLSRLWLVEAAGLMADKIPPHYRVLAMPATIPAHVTGFLAIAGGYGVRAVTNEPCNMIRFDIRATPEQANGQAGAVQ